MPLKPFTRTISVVAIALAAILSLVIAATPALQWRAKVIGMKAAGRLPEVPLIDLLRWMEPGSPVYLGGLDARPTVGAAIRNIGVDDPESIKRGQAHFLRTCAACHGGDANGGSAPSLLAFLSHATDWQFFSTVRSGRSGTAMAPQAVSEREIWEIHSFLSNKGRAWAREVAEQVALVAPKVDVPFSKLLDASNHPDEWLMYSGDLQAHRHSQLKQINRDNVRELRVAWATQLRPATKPLSATPIVANGTMFVSEAPDGVVALDARDGRVLWRFTRPVDPSKLPVCCGAINRGVAVLGKRVFVATLDSWLVALDAASGARLWEVQVADHTKGYSMTSAPLVLDGMVVVGVAGGETGIRGLLAAFSVEDGRRVWQFDTVPGPGEPGHETWAGDSWKTGGASTWSVGAYDPQLDILFWSTGNPWPPFDNRSRKGDNLYSNSIIALNPKTGKLLWHYQLTPADSNDWDATQQIVLADITWNGEKVPAALMASRNAFYYALDRRNGRFLYAKAFVKQTWSKGFDAKGRPTRDPASVPSPKGTMVYPWLHGGTNWWPPSYDPKRKLHYLATVDAATLYFTIDEELKPGTMTMRGTTVLASNVPAVMAVKAMDPDTGEARWTTRLDQGDFEQFARITGLLSTDGDLVFAGFMDRLSILDADTGAELWKFRPGALVNAGPSTYAIDGVQYFSIIAGNVLFAFALPPPNAQSMATRPSDMKTAAKPTSGAHSGAVLAR
jgi:alcohol dehydrogenase (cytochrome c)